MQLRRLFEKQPEKCPLPNDLQNIALSYINPKIYEYAPQKSPFVPIYTSLTLAGLVILPLNVTSGFVTNRNNQYSMGTRILGTFVGGVGTVAGLALAIPAVLVARSVDSYLYAKEQQPQQEKQKKNDQTATFFLDLNRQSRNKSISAANQPASEAKTLGFSRI